MIELAIMGGVLLGLLIMFIFLLATLLFDKIVGEKP